MLVVLLAFLSSAEETGDLRGEITIVGQESLRDGEVVVSLKGSDHAFDVAYYDSNNTSYSLELPPGEYNAYAWAPVFHASQRIGFNITVNTTTWLNLTVVRQEELLGEVEDEDGNALGDVVIQFLQDDRIVGTSQTNDQGLFRDTIDPGTYKLRITKRGYSSKELEVTIVDGEVKDLKVVLTEVPEDEEDEGPLAPGVIVGIVIIVAFFATVSYLRLQVRRLRMAAAEAEALRSRDSVCLECGGLVPERVPGEVLRVRPAGGRGGKGVPRVRRRHRLKARPATAPCFHPSHPVMRRGSPCRSRPVACRGPPDARGTWACPPP
jgi:hypothetical protein